MQQQPKAAAPARPSVPWRIALIAALAIVVLVPLAATLRAFVGGGPAAPDFTLTDQDGRPYTLSSHRGHEIALFFGYTHCPDVCPTTLSALARARKLLGSQGTQVDVVFVTVDPQRDSIPALRQYVRLFDPSFVGLGGTEQQLDKVYSAYHVFHQALPAQSSAAGYLVAHSSGITFIDPRGRIQSIGDWNDGPQDLAKEMRAALS